ncbi:MAG: hypothetical protein P8Y47_10570, partial [Alphaproteobacteria bacterium]
MLEWILTIARRKHINKYCNNIGPLLQRRYGLSKTYTIAQISKTVKAYRLSHRHIQYAYAMFASKKTFEANYQDSEEAFDYDALRQEIADICFSGYRNFSVKDAIARGEAYRKTYPNAVGTPLI